MLLIIIIGLFILLRKPKIYYTDDSSDWIERKGLGIKEINVDKVTKGTGYAGEDQLYLTINGSETVFPYEGFYKGEYFEQQKIKDGKLRMKISSTFKPNDGVIEAYVVERVINDTFEIFIFVDEDWKKEIPVTNIVWGKDYSRTKPFTFNEISSGIYMDQIDDDPERFAFNYKQSNTGIVVGNVNQQKVQNGIVDEFTTVIIFQ